jgi:HEAT repeat protein
MVTQIRSLIEKLDVGDLNAQWAAANALGEFGENAIEPLVQAYASKADPAMQAFILFALGKIKSPKIVKALPLALEASQSSNLELREAATRCLGKFAESIPREQFPVQLRRTCFEYLDANLSDENVTVRAKAVRSMGKMAKCGHLNEEERTLFRSICQNISGTDVAGNWDTAYIVRKEADEALGYI